MNTPKSLPSWLLRLLLLYLLFLIAFIIGGLVVAGAMPAMAGSDPGLVPAMPGLLIVALANVLVVAALILTSRWGGWKLAIALSLAYYGAVTALAQIESWYFLSTITVSPQLLPRLFLMGVPTAFFFVPVAAWVLGKRVAVSDATPNRALMMPIQQWVWKLAVLAAAYLLLYWGAGYFIAWQNPELRAFYGQPGDALPFFTHTVTTLRREPRLLPLQILRAILWILCALPIIRGSRVSPWWTALLVGLLFSIPQNVVHILANPLLPIASVRMSHMIETASSTFLFGIIVVWLLHREHHSWNDLAGVRASPSTLSEAA